MHNFVFNNLINFWVNLVVSAAFTYWVNHSTSMVKLPWRAQAERPAETQKALGEWIQKAGAPIMKLFKNQETKDEVAGNMAGVLTLTAAGHAVMIPSVWLGAKLKAPMVKALNRMHYGDEAMDDPTLKTRHALIEAEERPTLLGAVVGRAGTIVATQTAAYTLGSHVNLIRWIGEKTPLKFLSKFKGIDAITSQAGDNVGGGISKMIPQRMDKINEGMAKSNTWSLRQAEQHPSLLGENVRYGHKDSQGYGGGVAEHYGKYLVSDVMYSAVTAITIAPAINFLKNFIPGLTYKPEVSAEDQALLQKSAHIVKPRKTHLADEVEQTVEAAAPTIDTPGKRISHIQPHDRVAEAREKEVTA